MNSEQSLDWRAFLIEARRISGLEKFGSPDIEEPLRQLAGSLANEAKLTDFGRTLWHDRVLNYLVGRLRAEDWFARHPEILDEDLGSPVFILGLARTGSTLLHRLLASDTRFYAVAYWEARYAVPAPDDVSGERRMALGKAEVAAILEANPELAAIHPWDALGADEDNHLLDHTLMSTTHESMACIPSYHAWIATQDMSAACAYWKKMLQLVQWQKKQRGIIAQRWVLKSPVHMAYVDIIAKMFPQSQFIQTHRDPLATIPSFASLIYSLWAPVGDAADPVEAGRQTSATLERNLKRCMRARDAMEPGRFIDVDFRETVTQPLELMERIYAYLNMPLTPLARSQMREYLRSNPREKRPAHNYTLQQFGLTEADLKQRFEEYRRRYVRE